MEFPTTMTEKQSESPVRAVLIDGQIAAVNPEQIAVVASQNQRIEVSATDAQTIVEATDSAILVSFDVIQVVQEVAALQREKGLATITDALMIYQFTRGRAMMNEVVAQIQAEAGRELSDEEINAALRDKINAAEEAAMRLQADPVKEEPAITAMAQSKGTLFSAAAHGNQLLAARMAQEDMIDLKERMTPVFEANTYTGALSIPNVEIHHLSLDQIKTELDRALRQIEAFTQELDIEMARLEQMLRKLLEELEELETGTLGELDLAPDVEASIAAILEAGFQPEIA